MGVWNMGRAIKYEELVPSNNVVSCYKIEIIKKKMYLLLSIVSSCWFCAVKYIRES